MTKEIVEAVGVLEREKGISADRLMAALEDALLSAYKKTQGAAKYARVEVDRSSGDFRVYELLLPPDLEEQLLLGKRQREHPDVAGVGGDRDGVVGRPEELAGERAPAVVITARAHARAAADVAPEVLGLGERPLDPR